MKIFSKLKFGFTIPIFIIYSFMIVSGDSMEPTFSDGDLVWVDHAAYIFDEPKRGDIILFYSTDDRNDVIIKRIIGLPEETVKLKEGKIYIINNEDTFQLEEKYRTYPDTRKNIENSEEKTYEIPKGKYFVLGDNRRTSQDSRIWEEPFVPYENIIGKYAFYSVDASAHSLIFKP